MVKVAPDLDTTEVDNLGFIHSRTIMPVPKTLNAYEKDASQYLAMEFLGGEKLGAPGQSSPLGSANPCAPSYVNTSVKSAISWHQKSS